MNTPRTPLMQPTPPVGQEKAVEKMLVAANEIMGFIPDPLLLMGVSPNILAEFTEFLGHYETHPRLSSNLLAMMRYLVAARNDCKYCVTTSEGIMIENGMDLDDLRSAQEDPSTAPLPEKEKALLMLVLKMVLNSDEVEAADLEIAYANGWEDRDIYEAANYTVRNYAVDLLLKALKVDGQGAFN
ncbi:MAG: hypothetical protein M3H12_20510 [Chromatiales bacterium]|uniref:hypothetical protein n=1 Tax=endosymbiont of Lamellibrachia barhami TaxID=205975 RepID=UPI0015B2F7C6|nr:hypothetical protein [endosymbiont of Lamellibrachia barhami]MBA1443341.1 hypothetical protein [Gammaproteobacteria bacterium]